MNGRSCSSAVARAEGRGPLALDKSSVPSCDPCSAVSSVVPLTASRVAASSSSLSEFQSCCHPSSVLSGSLMPPSGSYVLRTFVVVIVSFSAKTMSNSSVGAGADSSTVCADVADGADGVVGKCTSHADAGQNGVAFLK